MTFIYPCKNSAKPRPWRNDVKMVHERGTCWKCYRFSNHIGFFNFRILIAGILTHLKVISSNNPCFIIGSTCVFTLWRFLRGELGSTLPPCLKDFLCARPSRKCWLAGISGLSNSCWSNDGCFLGVNDYFHCQDTFHQVQLPPVRNYGQGKALWSPVNVYMWTWEFMFCGPAK